MNGIDEKERKLNIYKRSPLHYAAEKNLKEIGEILISKGAIFDAKDSSIQTVIIQLLMNIIKKN